MSQPPPADDTDEAARRPPTSPEPTPSDVSPDEPDRTQRVRSAQATADAAGTDPASGGPEGIQRAETSPPARAPEPSDEPDRTQRVELPAEPARTQAGRARGIDLPTSTAGPSTQRPAGERIPADTRTGEPSTRVDEAVIGRDDTTVVAEPVAGGDSAGRSEPAWPTAEHREPQWPADDSTETPPTGMRALPRRQPWEDMDTPRRGIGAQRPAAARQEGQRPAPGRRRDPLWPHFAWEAVLVVGVMASALVMAGTVAGDVFDSEVGLRNLALRVAAAGLLASGLALSLRVAAPNLAVGAIAGLAGVTLVWFVNEADMPLGTAVPLVLLAAAGAGLVLAIVVVGLHVPAWAATLGAAFAIEGIALSFFGANLPVLSEGVGAATAEQGWLWFGVFAAISVIGGALWALPGVRDRLAGTRSDRDPAARPGAAAGLGATLGLVGSSVLAAGGGILFTLITGVPDTGRLLTVVALAAVLLGGVSAFGRRGGVFGTLLAVVILELLRQTLLTSRDGEPWELPALVASAVLVGLVVTRLLELAGRRRGTA